MHAGASGQPLPEGLRRIMADPGRATALRLWTLLHVNEREEVAEAFMRGRPVNRTNLVRAVAAARNFRPATVGRWPDAKIAEAMKHVRLRHAKHAAELLGALDDVPKWRMTAHRFAGLLGLADPAAVHGPGADVPSERVRAGAASLAGEFGPRDAAVYLLFVSRKRSPVSEHLKAWLRDQAQRPAPDASAAPDPAATPATSAAGAPAPSTGAAVAPTPATPVVPVRDDAVAPGASPSSDGSETPAAPPRLDAAEAPATAGTGASSGSPIAAVPPAPSEPPAAVAAPTPPEAPAAAAPVPVETSVAPGGHLSSASARPGASPSPAASTASPGSASPTPTGESARADSFATEPKPQADSAEAGPGGSLTTLDFVLLRAVEDARDGIRDALSEDEVDDMVDDYVHLNGRRHRSHLHAGFRDALFGRRLVEQWAETSRRRARWYWAGVVRGWARSASWARIVDEFDRRELVRGLGDGSPPSAEGVEHVVRALRAEGRLRDLAEFVRPRALAVSADSLFKSLLDAGTELLRNGDAANGLAVFERLRQAPADSAVNDSPYREQLVLDARRRQAHCLRHLGQADKARRILQNLLKRDPTARVRAMAHADLGLLKGGFRELNDVRLPREPEAREKLLHQLEAGRQHFDKSAEDDVRYASHGHYCLGVLAMCRREYDQAAERFKQAHAVIGAGPGQYDGRLVARTGLYLGVAEVLLVSEQDSSLGTRRIVEGLKQGAALPPYFVGEIIDALQLVGATSDLQLVAEWIQKTGDEDAFDTLAAGPAVDHCKWMAPALYGRACRPGRKKKDAVGDLVTALRGYRAMGAFEDTNEAALDVIDMLEDYATQGIETAQFTELLRRDDYDCPPLLPEDARVAHAGCLEAQGSFQSAADVLGPLFFEAAKRRKLYDAEGVLEQIKELGLPNSYYDHMEQRLAQLSNSVVSEKTPDEYPRRVTVLVVGGDERQAKREPQVQRAIKERDAAVVVRFVRSGWRANWQKPLDAVRGALKECDAVVIMRFIRTHFGRRVRDECGAAAVPWCYCWSAGDAGQVRAVLEAATIARSGSRSA